MPDDGVSCLCLTYGRPHLLEEAIESFLRQTWPGTKELLVLNDHPAQILRCDRPGVVVVNLPRRLPTLGEKRNLSVALARYDNLLVWDDDDIYLPWRIDETMRRLPRDQFFKCPHAWVMNDGTIKPEPEYNLFHGGTAYTRWLFHRAGGYARLNGGEDCDLEHRFQHVTPTKGEFWPHTTLPKDRLYYIYRWGHGSYHATGCADLAAIDPPAESGEIQLEPRWRLPYADLAAAAAAGRRPAPAAGRSTAHAIHFIIFSKDRPLQLDGYLRSFRRAFAARGDLGVSVLYAAGSDDYRAAYDRVAAIHPWATFVRQASFFDDLRSLFDASPFTCFGCDDVVFTGAVDVDRALEVMRRDAVFAFSFRLGRNITRSMFHGPTTQPPFDEWGGGVLAWDLHRSHAHGDFGYAWELNGTVYPTDVARRVADDVRPASPNLLEAAGGGRWSSKTGRHVMACFHASKLVVPTVNVVQTDFANPVLAGRPIGTRFLLDAWESGLRLDVGRYESAPYDCIHVGELFLTNLPDPPPAAAI